MRVLVALLLGLAIGGAAVWFYSNYQGDSRLKAAEEKVARAEAFLDDPSIATDAEELHKRQLKVDEARAKVAALFERWEELEAKSRGA